MANYSQITNQQTQARLDQRYRIETEALNNLGFQHLDYCLEDHGAFSALKFPLASLFALVNREVLNIKSPFRLTVANVLMSIYNPPTIALCMGMGVKFYTPFYDGTVMISSNFDSRFSPRPGSMIIRLPSQGTLADTWIAHRAQALTHSKQVDFLSREMVLGVYTQISIIEEFEANL